MEQQEQVKSIVASVMELYRLTTPESTLKGIIDTKYAKNAAFENPLVNVTGADDISNHFLFNRGMLMQKEQLPEDERPRTRYTHSVSLVHTAVFDHTTKVINMELCVYYHLRPLVFGFLRDMVPIAVRVFVSLELDPVKLETEQKMIIIKHTDRWSISEILDDVPVVGSVYEWARKMAGKTTAIATKVTLSTVNNVSPMIQGYVDRVSA